MRTKQILAMLVLALALPAGQVRVSEAAPLGTAFTYQGRLLDDNRAADGQYDFRFRLYDGADPATGDQQGITIYMNEVEVIEGYFTVELDFSLDPNAFGGHRRWLDIGVRPGQQSDPNVYMTLTPRQEVTATPYALQTRGLYVDNLGNLGLGTGSPAAKLEVRGDVLIGDDGYALTDEFDFWEDQSSHSYVTTGTCKHGAYACGDDDSLRIGSGLTGSGSVQIIVSVKPDAATVKLRYIVPWAGGTGGALYVDGVNKGLIDDNGCNWQEKLLTGMSAHTADGLLEIEIADEVAGNDGDVQITYMEVYSPTTSALDVAGDANVAGNLTVGGKLGVGTATPGYSFHQEGGDHVVEDSDIALRRDNRHRWRFVEGAYSGLSIKQVYDDSGALQNKVLMEISDSGKVGIGTTSPYCKLQVEDDTAADVTTMIHNQNDAGSERLYFGTSTSSDAGIIAYGSTNASYRGKWRFFNNKTSGHYDWITGNSVRMTLTNAGDLGIGTANPASDLHIVGDAALGSALIAPLASSNADSEIVLAEDNDYTYGMSIKFDGGDNNMYVFGKSGATSYGPHLTITRNSGNVGIGTDSPTRKLTVRGNILLQSAGTGATILELGEGLDYAEGFHVSESTHIGPGSVLVIDSDNPGKLALSDKAYDRKVAGIVAGAKGLGSGVRLGAGGFDYDVALAGRVYCNVDATEQGVEPGDLLTTSSTPGCAAKVTDHALAQGAILGKAMEKLEKGQKGQILVLVTLQ
ncbi:MAG: hypothetical protein ACYTEQ_02865 [Planctomycetota bacterium]|jgi:hypothetical protein